MTYIKKIVMTGFKSFGDRTVSVKFGSGFTCIVGPNGNGKSNIVDAICFALGRLSKKTMRAKNLTDLIFAGTKTQKGANRAEVEIYFDNKDRVFPIESDDYIISRHIYTDGRSGYKVNGKNATRQDILNALAQASIDPDGSNQFVLQGKIVELTHMNTTDRRLFIESLIGLEKYDEMKNQSLAELEKADQDLGQFEAIYKEVSTQLKKVEREKNDALRWKELDNAIQKYNAQLIALKISILRAEEEKVEHEIDETKIIIDDLNSKINKKKDEIEQINHYIKNLQNQLDTHNSEKEELDRNISNARTELSSKEAELKAAKANLDRLFERKKKLEEQQTKLAEGETYELLISRTKQALESLQKQIDETNSVISEAVSEQKVRESKIADHNKKKSSILSEISKVRENISKLDAEINLLNKNIKKNTDKKDKEENELKKLKKEDESIEEALKKAQEQSDKILKTIEDLRANIAQLTKEQKDLDKEIIKVEKEKEKANNKITETKSEISSKQAEISMTENRISALNKKIQDLTNEYNRLSQGKSIEEAIKSLKEKEKEKLNQIKGTKDKLNNLQSGQKKKEVEKEGLELKKNSVQNEINDFNNRISALKVEVANIRKELKNAERDKTSLDLLNQGLAADIKSLEESMEKTKKKQDSCLKRIDEKNKEKELKQVDIKRREAEYESSKNEVDSVLKILEMMLERINFSINEIKSTMQNAGEEVLDDTVNNFKNYVLDINDIFNIITETIDSKKGVSPAEIESNMKEILSQFNMLNENTKMVIDNFMNNVRSSQDQGLKKSMEPIDIFIKDLSELFDNARIVFSKLTLSQSSDIYMELDQINNEIAALSKENTGYQTELATLITKLEQKKNEFNTTSIKIKDLEGKIKDLSTKADKSDEELKSKNEQIIANTKKIEEINLELKKIKEFSDSYWKEQQNIQAEIDAINTELSKIQADLNELNTINRILKEREEAEKEIETSKKIIDDKKVKITELDKKIGSINEEITAIVENINKLKQDKENKFTQAQELQVNIDKENDNLKQITDVIRGLETVQKLIKSIENLKAEIAEAEEKIAVNKEQIEAANKEIEEKNKLIKSEEDSIAELTKERKDLEKVEADNREKIIQLNKEVQATNKTLSEQEQMLKRDLEIKEIIQETEFTNKSISQLEETIKSVDEKIGSLEQLKTEKVGQINKLNQELQEGFNKQNQLRDEYSELNAQLSKQTTILNQLESRKSVLNDKIQGLFDMGKEYGTLPPVTPDLSESGLNQSIDQATREKKSLEPVNLKAIEYYDEIKERFDEIDTRRQTLQRERKAIMDSIERLELEKRKQFMKAFHEINRVFSEVFEKLSPGGSARMMLENPSEPFQGGIEIEARPRGKKISSLDILSGGEKTLVALSFIFSVQTFYPAPFYIMDEIDAALDGPNVFAVSNVIKEYSKRAQFIVISHREENISNADRIYGVAMQNQITDIFMHDISEQVEDDASKLAAEGGENPTA